MNPLKRDKFHPHQRWFIATTLVLALVPTACSDSGSSSTKSKSSNTDDSSDSQNSSAASEFKSPLADALGQNNDDYARNSARAELEIQSCMAKEGFTYIPQKNLQVNTFSAEDSPGPQNPEWRKQYGFGIVINVLEPGGDANLVTEEEYVDPNQKMIDKMSKAEQRAYFLALDGFDPEASEPVANGSAVPSEAISEGYANSQPKGCRGIAYSKINGGFNVDESSMALTEELYQAVDDRIVASRSFASASKKYVDCIGDMTSVQLPKHPKDTYFQGTLYERIQNKLYKIAPDFAPQKIEGGGSEGAFVTEVAVGEGSKELTDAQRADLKKLLKEEIRLAEADATCDKKASLADTVTDERIRAERAIVEERADDIAALTSSTRTAK